MGRCRSCPSSRVGLPHGFTGRAPGSNVAARCRRRSESRRGNSAFANVRSLRCSPALRLWAAAVVKTTQGRLPSRLRHQSRPSRPRRLRTWRTSRLVERSSSAEMKISGFRRSGCRREAASFVGRTPVRSSASSAIEERSSIQLPRRARWFFGRASRRSTSSRVEGGRSRSSMLGGSADFVRGLVATHASTRGQLRLRSGC